MDQDAVSPIKKRKKHYAFLIAVEQKREKPRVYAVLAPTAEEALARVSTEATSRLELVGQLSRHMAQRLKLKSGEVRLV